jgi:hypothetical protein
LENLMRTRLLLGTLGGVLMVCAAAVQAQSAPPPPPIKPGLWQVQTDNETDGKKMPDMGTQMKTMPPDMRKRMEDNMKQHGIDMSGGPGQMKMCMTRESLDSGKWQGQQTRCKTDFNTGSGVWKWRSTCDQPPSVTDGEAAFASAEAYTVKSSTTMTMKGKQHLSKMTLNAKWLGADCGDLKPFSPPTTPAPKAKP